MDMNTPIIDDDYRKLLKEHKQLWLLREQFDARPLYTNDRVALYKSNGRWTIYTESTADSFPGFIYFSREKMNAVLKALIEGDVTLE